MINKYRTKKEKVIVAMSGGVDSSVAAAILKGKGYDVAGVFMHLWSEDAAQQDNIHEQENKCCSLDAEEQARKVAQTLRIPFYVLNFEKKFKKHIVDYFIREYSIGNTPNPCVECNKRIKFGFLFDKIQRLNADFLATGHYVRRRKAKNKNIYKLYKAIDETKDQSYFLYNLTQDKLSRLLFPLGSYKKSEIRKKAEKLNLPTAARKESQDVCFVPKKGYKYFIRRHLKDIKSGNIVDMEGKIIGRHKGLPFYTKGQRRGIMIGGGDPYYVIGMDYKKNTLIVTKRPRDVGLYSNKLRACEINWISGHFPQTKGYVDVKIRYRQKAAKARIQKKGSSGCVLVEFEKGQRAVTRGQSAVFYRDKELLGGGIIK